MRATVDGRPVPVTDLGWPAMNFCQFRWHGQIGRYELVIPRPEFVDKLTVAYRQMEAELRADDLMVPDQSSPLKLADYPPLANLPDSHAAFLEAVSVYLRDELFAAFLPDPRSTLGSVMVNSIESCAASVAEVVIRGRGYHSPTG